MKKAQGISMNVIIIAAIALLVLVVLAIIFMGRMGLWGEQTTACENKGGMCYDTAGTTCDEASGGAYPQAYAIWKCPTEGETCCIAIS